MQRLAGTQPCQQNSRRRQVHRSPVSLTLTRCQESVRQQEAPQQAVDAQAGHAQAKLLEESHLAGETMSSRAESEQGRAYLTNTRL